MARKGAARVDDPEATTAASGAWRSAVESARPPVRRNLGPSGSRPPRTGSGRAPAPEARSGPPPAKAPEAWEPEEWILEPDLAVEAEQAVARGRGRGGRPTAADTEVEIEADVRAELARAVGSTKVAKFEVRLKDATRAFEAERFSDAARMLKKLADDAPSAAAVRELYGLTLYRQGKWRQAAHELEAFHVLTDSTEQHPVLADCYRALHNYAKVDELWRELKAASPGAELVTEGRIVAAGALADQGDNRGAIRLLEQGFSFPKRPRDHHLRRAYALADCYERAGDVIRARELFNRIAVVDPSFADARRRARALR